MPNSPGDGPAPDSDDITTVLRDSVATVRLGNPERLTVLTVGLASRLEMAITSLAGDPGVRCIIVTGSGRVFVAGADVVALRAASVDEAVAFNRALVTLADRVTESAVPVICCLNGHAFGGGLELALACSVRIVDADAKLGFPEVKVGILPGSGGMLRLPQFVGRGAMIDLLTTGRTVDAAEAFELGLVDKVATAGSALEQAHALAREIVAAAPLAVRAILDVIQLAPRLAHSEATALVEDRLRTLFASADANEGFTAFLERRPPQFGAR